MSLRRDRLEVRVRDGRTFPAKLVAADDKTDVAVLKIDAKDLPVVDLGNSDLLRVGQLVCAIGAPFNQDYSFTCGWVSGKGRSNLLSPGRRRFSTRITSKLTHSSTQATAAARSSTWTGV
jgi:S1-C subfamily serine protease